MTLTNNKKARPASPWVFVFSFLLFFLHTVMYASRINAICTLQSVAVARELRTSSEKCSGKILHPPLAWWGRSRRSARWSSGTQRSAAIYCRPLLCVAPVCAFAHTEVLAYTQTHNTEGNPATPCLFHTDDFFLLKEIEESSACVTIHPRNRREYTRSNCNILTPSCAAMPASWYNRIDTSHVEMIYLHSSSVTI